MSGFITLDALIGQAIDERSANLAGQAADFCRFNLKMTYSETLARVQKVRPKVTQADWEDLMQEADGL